MVTLRTTRYACISQSKPTLMTLFTPVIEFAPGDYSNGSRGCPDVSSAENRVAWIRYWKESLADSGIEELEPHGGDSWFVPIAQITRPNTIRKLLEAHFEGEKPSSLDEVGALAGGYFLTTPSGEIAPGCCGDLSNIGDWAEAANHEEETWAMVWIGHPWTHAASKGSVLTLLEPTEEDPPETSRVCLTVERVELKDAIKRMDPELKAFSSRLEPYVEEMNLGLPTSSVLKVLIWADYEE